MSNNSGVIISGDGMAASMQVVQSIYARLTGRREQISKNFDINHISSFEDFQNLHFKIKQICEPYVIISSNESVVVYHSDDNREQFSSFDRFRGYNKSSLSPVENVRIEYNLLIELPVAKDPQSYKISIDVHSRASILKKSVEKEGMAAVFFSMVAENTGSVKIDYIDYVVAVNFMAAVDNWFAGLKRGEDRPYCRLLKRYSHHFGSLMQFFSLSIFLSISYFSSISRPVSVDLIIPRAIEIFGGCVIVAMFSQKIGRFIEHQVDSVHPESYVILNRGDELAADAIKRKSTKAIRRSVLAFSAAIVVNIVSNAIGTWVGIAGN